jgi:S-adenosylmethionine:tRNA ribosyltransferase-isomerase
MKTSDLHYTLPSKLIAQHPCEQRDASRLLVVDRASGTLQEDVYSNVAQYLRRGDCMVLNNTRVIRARLHGRKATGGRVEIFLLHETGPAEWTALVRPSAKVKPGTEVGLTGGHSVRVEERLPEGRRRVCFSEADVLRLLEEVGEIPLPPYIHREGQDPSDLRRYQTVFAAQPGAVAAPTAGLHFTEEVFQNLDAAGVCRSFLTLHVGYGTFKPITVERLEDHQVASEDFHFPEDTADALNQCRGDGGRVVAVGTTATRVLETQFQAGQFHAGEGETNAYIYPPYTFGGVDLLQTNFHLPQSSLLALVCAFGGRDLILEAYHHAIEKGFRFYSYGDVMLIR